MRVCARIYVCATCLWVCFGACVFVCVRVCVINVGVYLCGPVMVCQEDRMKHAEVRYSMVHVDRSRIQANRGVWV